MRSKLDGRTFELIRASDLVRDGMGLEAKELRGDDNVLILEAFWCDADGRFTFTAFQPDLPFDLVEQFVRVARSGLPPLERICKSTE